MSFGTTGFGSGSYGAGGGGILNLLSAASVSPTVVDLTFNVAYDPDAAAATPGNYTFDNGLVASSVIFKSATEIRITTNNQVDGVTYTVTVNAAINGASGEVFGINTVMFIHLATFVVSDLISRSHCNGKRVDLFWTNPTAPPTVGMRIVRRQKNWVFDLTDAHDVVYDGTVISEFFDTGVVAPVVDLTFDVSQGDTTINIVDSTGFSINDVVRLEQLDGTYAFELVTVTAVGVGTLDVTAVVRSAGYTVALKGRVGIDSALLDEVFYYYTILASTTLSPPDDTFAFTDANHAFALSIPVLDSKEDFFWANTPAVIRENDFKVDGGNNFLDDWYSVFGCWLNLMRGHAVALKLLGDDDQTPYNTLSAKNFSLGIDPEGFSFDFEVPRRSILSLKSVYSSRGTCDGIIQAVRMFTKWESLCSEFGLGGCGVGTSPFRMYDGTSICKEGNGDSGTVTSVNRLLTDTAALFDTDEFEFGKVIGPIGDTACVDDNTTTQLVLQIPDTSSLISGVVAMGATTIPVTNVSGFLPGMTLQLEQDADFLNAEIVEIDSVDPGVPSFDIKEPTLFAYVANDRVSIGKSLLRREFLGSGGTWATISGNTRELTYTPSGWVQTQWTNYKVLDADNVLHDVTSNEGDTLRIEAGVLPSNGVFAISRDFTVGASFALRDPIMRYKVCSGRHSTWFEPTLDLERRGTNFDDFNRLWMGPGSPTLGAWGSGDVGIYITTDVALHIGRATTAVGAVFDLDPNQAAPTVDEFVGDFLNPNQNQTQLFQIISNTATTVTVNKNMSSLVVPEQYYYILNPRDASRFRAITRRLGPPLNEFSNMDITVRVLFA